MVCGPRVCSCQILLSILLWPGSSSEFLTTVLERQAWVPADRHLALDRRPVGLHGEEALIHCQEA